jgi:Leucine-rich repeat (LRR) protein
VTTQLGRLTNLSELDINTNELSGTIPSEYGNMIELEALNIRNNRLTGSIPSEILAFPN